MSPIPSPQPLVDPVNRIVLFTNAKCAGTTCKRWFFTNLDLAAQERRPIRFVGAFGLRYALRHLRYGRTVTPRGEGLSDVQTLRRMTSYYRRAYCIPALEAGTTETFFRFAVVRNPEDRLVSAYFDKFCGADRGQPWVRKVVEEAGSEGEITFDRFLDYLEATPQEHCNAHWRRQTHVLAGHRVDAYVRMERMLDDLRGIADRIGAAHFHVFEERLQTSPSGPGPIAEIGSLASTRAGVIADWVERNGAYPPKAALLTDATRARIRRIYAEDYAALPY